MHDGSTGTGDLVGLVAHAPDSGQPMPALQIRLLPSRPTGAGLKLPAADEVASWAVHSRRPTATYDPRGYGQYGSRRTQPGRFFMKSKRPRRVTGPLASGWLGGP